MRLDAERLASRDVVDCACAFFCARTSRTRCPRPNLCSGRAPFLQAYLGFKAMVLNATALSGSTWQGRKRSSWR